MKKKRYFELDFIRVIATFSILIFHYCVQDKAIYNRAIFFPNIDLGHFGVSLFFILSGVSLVVSEKKKFSVLDFYKSRVKSIFPLFYLGTIVFFVINFLINPHTYDGIRPVCLLFTLLGLDGLFSFRFRTFYQVGEWYLGCIILLYLIYPILRFFIHKYPKIVPCFLLLFSIILYCHYPFRVPYLYNPGIRILEFVFGIYFGKYFISSSVFQSTKKRIFILFFSFLGFLFFAVIPNSFNLMIPIFFSGIFAFSFLFTFAKYLEFSILKKGIDWIVSYSYAIFIVHHQIVWYLYYRFQNDVLTRANYCYLFGIYLLLVFLAAYLLKFISDRISILRKVLSS